MSARRAPRSAGVAAAAALHSGGESASEDEAVSDHDGLERVGGPSGAKGKRRTSAAPRPRKKRRTDADEDDDQAAGASTSALVSAIAARASAGANAGVSSLEMSRVSRAAHATHLTYFDQLSASAKSKNTLKDVNKLSAEQRARISASLPVRHPEEKARLIAYHTAAMREWYLQMRAGGYNLLAYGFGSKKKLLSDFARTWLTDGPVIVCNGYLPTANVKNLLNVLTRDLMNLPSQTFRDLHAHVEFVREWFRNDARVAAGGRRGRATVPSQHDSDSDSDADDKRAAAASCSSSTAFLPRVYLLIHNIDGASLRSETQQHILALLASIPQVHLVASVDHIMSGWLWDQSLLNHFNFVHHDCTTYAEYSSEFLFGGGEGAGARSEGALVDTSQSGRSAGIVNVLTSLTPNHRKVLDVLAREQLTPANPNFLEGTSFVTRAAFLNACEENMLVANEASFSRLLNELRDHNLVEEKVVSRVRVVSIPYSALVIRRHILGEQEENAAVMEAAAAAAELARREAATQEENPFAYAVGLAPEGEADDAQLEEDEDSEEEDA